MVPNSLKLLERLDQPILDVIDNPEKTQQNTAIGRYFDKRSSLEKVYHIFRVISV